MSTPKATASRFALDRRTLLRGAVGGLGLSVGLPILEAMLDDHGTAFAQGEPLPRRFGLFFWANGTPWNGKHDPNNGEPDLWTPPTEGPLTLSPLLQTFAGLESKMTVVTGLEPKSQLGNANGDPNRGIDPGQGDGHMRGVVHALTGDRPRPQGFVQPDHIFTVQRPTIDQQYGDAPEIQGATPPRFRSVVTSVSAARFHQVPDFGTWESISLRGPDQLVPPIPSARDLFLTLFSDAPPDDPVARAETLERIDVLSAVKNDLAAVKRRLGRSDVMRLDEHVTAVEEIERRLKSAQPACTQPSAPGDVGDLAGQAEAQARLIAHAMTCDRTRVFSMMLTSPGGQHVFGQLGLSGGSHQLAHDAAHEPLRRITEYHMQCFRRVLDVFASTPDVAGGSLLDSMAILGTSEYAEGKAHNVSEFPVILAGGLRGRIRQGQHLRYPSGNLARVHLTLHQAFGLNVQSWGWDGGETSEPLPILV